MESYQILKVLKNGWVVPYPDEVVYRDMLILKDYRLNDYPRDEKGNFNKEIPYEEWLQDYLYNCQIDLTENQRKVRDFILANNDYAAISLGWDAGFYENSHGLYPIYDFPEDFEEHPDIENLKGLVYDDPYQDFMDVFDDDEEPRPSKLEYILEDYGYYLLLCQEEKCFQEYWPGFVKIIPAHWMFGWTEPNMELPDSAWRIYLSFILKAIPDKLERLKQIENFFLEYGDALHK